MGLKVTPPQLAKRWGCEAEKVLNFIRSGELRAINLATDRRGRPRYKIDEEDVADFERRREVATPRKRARPSVKRETELVRF